MWSFLLLFQIFSSFIVAKETNHHVRSLKSILFVRHGQAYSNIARCEDRPDLRDPFLTELGIHQSRNIIPLLSHYLSSEFIPDLILFSPLRRAIQTLNSSLLKFCIGTELCLPLADLQEDNNGLYACDTGHSPQKLQKQFPLFNFSSLPHDWMTDGIHQSQIEKLSLRHLRVRKWLSTTLKRKILIFAHQGTIRGLPPSSAAAHFSCRRYPESARGSLSQPWRYLGNTI
jgi:broad specificity phosphatase PhoE